jgi:hypothetical protein
MKHGKVNEIRGFDLTYPASGEVVELRGLRSPRGQLTHQKGGLVTVVPSRGVKGRTDSDAEGGGAGSK